LFNDVRLLSKRAGFDKKDKVSVKGAQACLRRSGSVEDGWFFSKEMQVL